MPVLGTSNGGGAGIEAGSERTAQPKLEELA
jgi:hypothetical protein